MRPWCLEPQRLYLAWRALGSSDTSSIVCRFRAYSPKCVEGDSQKFPFRRCLSGGAPCQLPSPDLVDPQDVGELVDFVLGKVLQVLVLQDVNALPRQQVDVDRVEAGPLIELILGRTHLQPEVSLPRARAPFSSTSHLAPSTVIPAKSGASTSALLAPTPLPSSHTPPVPVRTSTTSRGSMSTPCLSSASLR